MAKFKIWRWEKAFLILFIITYAVFAYGTDNSSLSQVTAFKIDYFQWKEYVPSQLPEYNDVIVSENGPLYHLILTWNWHDKTRLGCEINTDVFWGNPEYIYHDYSTTLDTILTVFSSTQYVGMNVGIVFKLDFEKIAIGRMVFSLTPNAGIKYLGWKRSIPWYDLYVRNAGYIGYTGADEYWNTFLPTVGVQLTQYISTKIKLSIDLNGSIFGYVLERSDINNSSIDHYRFDVHPELHSYFDGKANFSIGCFLIGITASRIAYRASEIAYIPQDNADRLQPASIADYYGLTFGYTFPIFKSIVNGNSYRH